MPVDYYIARQVGTQNVALPIFVGNVTTGAGLTNIVASTVGFSWYRNDMAAASTGTCTNGTLGTYSVSSFLQVLSTGMRGWYTFGIPNSVFVSGTGAAIRLTTAAMEVNIFIELTKTDNQTYMSSQTISTALNSLGANVVQILGSTPVTTAAGELATRWDLGRTTNTASTLALTGTTISTNQIVNAGQILGSTPVTTAAGVLATAWDLGRTANLTSTVALTGFSVAYATTAGAVTGLNAALLDVSVSSRLPTATYTVPPTVAQITSGLLNTSMAESYRAAASTGTLSQVVYELLAHHGEASISGVTKTIKQTDQATDAATFTLDSSTAPTSITRAT